MSFFKRNHRDSPYSEKELAHFQNVALQRRLDNIKRPLLTKEVRPFYEQVEMSDAFKAKWHKPTVVNVTINNNYHTEVNTYKTVNNHHETKVVAIKKEETSIFNMLNIFGEVR